MDGIRSGPSASRSRVLTIVSVAPVSTRIDSSICPNVHKTTLSLTKGIHMVSGDEGGLVSSVIIHGMFLDLLKFLSRESLGGGDFPVL